MGCKRQTGFIGHKSLFSHTFFIIFLAACTGLDPSLAQTNSLLDAWRAYCDGLPSESLRRDCLDAAAQAENKSPPRSGAASPLPSVSPEQAFGAEDLDIDGKTKIGLAPPKNERLDQVEGEVIGLRVIGPGRLEFVLDNGQTWRQQEPANLLAPAPPFNVRIQKGALGNYRLTVVRTKRTASVTRVE
jgi:hypothetical protein